MDWGFEFDDSMFEDPKEKKKNTADNAGNANFKASTLTPQWFQSVEDSDETLPVLKHSAEFAYRNRDYATALHCYMKCQDLLPVSNQVIWKDVTESICRCHLALCNLKQALQTATALHERSCNFDQKSSTWLLLARVHRQMNNCAGERQILHMLITMHPSNADFWMRLAELSLLMLSELYCYKRSGHKQHECQSESQTWHSESETEADDEQLVLHDSCEACGVRQSDSESKTTSHEQADCCSESESRKACSAGHNVDCERTRCIVGSESKTFTCSLIRQLSDTDNEMKQCKSETTTASNAENIENKGQKHRHVRKFSTEVHLKTICCACLVRERMLLQFVQSSVASFAKQRNEILQDRICSMLSSLELCDPDIELCTEYIRNDLTREKSKRIILDETALAELNLEDVTSSFDATWFPWLFKNTDEQENVLGANINRMETT